jgi:hypothetical protein
MLGGYGLLNRSAGIGILTIQTSMVVSAIEFIFLNFIPVVFGREFISTFIPA